ncbi:MAG: hypothetical protein ABEH64_11990 [Salinirussus sp.]
MAYKGDGPATDWLEIDDFAGGFGWMAYPDEGMQRASHALVEDGDVWLVDPVDTVGLDDRIAEAGRVAGVVVLLDRHTRDAGTIAARHDVPVYVPETVGSLGDRIQEPARTFQGELADTGYRTHPVFERFPWREAALFSEERDTLVVAEALGTNTFSTTPGERLGVQPFARLFPPTSLGRFDPERILVGHGTGIDENAGEALRTALRGARRGLPRLAVQDFRLVAGL